MAETVAVHHPNHPGSDMVVTRKAYDVDLSREGYVLGHSDGSNPATAPTPPAQDGGLREQVDAGELAQLRHTVQQLTERETALELRAVELDQRERELEEREEELAGQVTAGAQQGTEAPPAAGETDEDRRARKAASERHRRATRRAAGTTTPTPEEATP